MTARLRLTHWSDKPLGQVRSVAPGHRGMGADKPMGLWLSDERPESVMSWKEWCESESFGLDKFSSRADFDIDRARVLVLSSSLDIDYFTDEFSLSCDRNIDWVSVSKNWGGIVITPYQWSRRLEGRAGWYYSWDCACACVWDASVLTRVP